MGEMLLKTGAATWAAKQSLGAIGVTAMSPMMIMIVFAVADILCEDGVRQQHCDGLRSDSDDPGLSAQRKDAQSAHRGHDHRHASYIILFSCVLPVNSPQTMIPYGTDTFEAKEYIRIALPFTIVALAGLVPVLPDLLALGRTGVA